MTSQDTWSRRDGHTSLSPWIFYSLVFPKWRILSRCSRNVFPSSFNSETQTAHLSKWAVIGSQWIDATLLGSLNHSQWHFTVYRPQEALTNPDTFSFFIGYYTFWYAEWPRIPKLQLKLLDISSHADVSEPVTLPQFGFVKTTSRWLGRSVWMRYVKRDTCVDAVINRSSWVL